MDNINKIQISCLGEFGRFGNQLFQYCVAKAWSVHLGVPLEIPDNWIGRKLFNVPESSVIHKLPKSKFEELPSTPGWDLNGYFQHTDAVKLLNRKDVLRWLTPSQSFQNLLDITPEYDCVCHLRRGDFNLHQDVFCTVSHVSYLKLLNRLDISNPVWVSEEVPHSVWGYPGWLVDFAIMVKARTLIRSNSTFSWWAASLGQNNVYSPIVGSKTGTQSVKFINNNSPKVVDSSNTDHPEVRISNFELK